MQTEEKWVKMIKKVFRPALRHASYQKLVKRHNTQLSIKNYEKK